MEKNQKYSDLNLSLEVESLFHWIKKHNPDWSYEKIIYTLKSAVDKFEDDLLEVLEQKVKN